LILFGSLARGDYMEHSDADFCIVLRADPETPFAGFDRAVALDPSGAVQPLVYGARQFRRMMEQANGLALEVLADGVFLAGDEEFRKEIEALAASTRERLGIERTPGGWRITSIDVS
jgi:Nucleotidyltransferase domain